MIHISFCCFEKVTIKTSVNKGLFGPDIDVAVVTLLSINGNKCTLSTSKSRVLYSF